MLNIKTPLKKGSQTTETPSTRRKIKVELKFFKLTMKNIKFFSNLYEISVLSVSPW